ncbi:hypothetical protein HAX54_030599 [Datura stramonium]|uniref:Sulfotransferase n=1 Tax=Datura stramonium TaxID=4076 RepID=A0ABS8V972_DATST|nr:hypothetical protein [Datura stramonium]
MAHLCYPVNSKTRLCRCRYSKIQSLEEDAALINELSSALFWDAMEIKIGNFLFEPGLIKCAMTFSSCFQAGNDDVLLTSAPKTGTTWLKALCLCILHQSHTIPENEDLLTKDSPQFHVQTIELSIYSTKPTPDLENQELYPLERAIKEFCTGVHQYGPNFKNLLGYGLKSQKRPEKTLFLKRCTEED